MANYSETVLYSSVGGTTGNIALSGYPSAYDYMRISYGSPVIGRTTSTALVNIGPMMTVTLPTSMNYANLYSNFYGTASTTNFYTPYRACETLSGASSNNWTRVFNRYGTTNSWEVRTNAAWTNVYMIVGVKTGSQGNFHKDLLYDYNRDGTGNTLNLTAHPSGYRRIGIIAGLSPTSTGLISRSTQQYQEYPYFHLTNGSGKSGYIVTYHKYVDTPVVTNNIYAGALYSGCGTQTWKRVMGRYLSETGGNGATGNVFGQIYQVIGIDRI